MNNTALKQKIKSEVEELCKKFPVYEGLE